MLTIRDLGSRNGVSLDGQRIEDESELRPGAALTLGDARLWLENLEVRETGDVAVATADWLFDRDVAGAGPAQRGPVTFVLVRQADGWLIIHAHFANDPPPRRRP